MAVADVMQMVKDHEVKFVDPTTTRRGFSGMDRTLARGRSGGLGAIASQSIPKTDRASLSSSMRRRQILRESGAQVLSLRLHATEGPSKGGPPLRARESAARARSPREA